MIFIYLFIFVCLFLFICEFVIFAIFNILKEIPNIKYHAIVK